MTWNAVLALGGSAASMALAAAGWLGPIMAAAAQSAGVLAVVLNSGRLLRTLDVRSGGPTPVEGSPGRSHEGGDSDDPRAS